MPRKTAKNRKKPKPRLSPNQIKAAGMLASGDRYIVVAERCGVDADTLRRWRQSEGFKAKIIEFQQIQSEEIQYSLKANARAVSENLKLAIATVNGIMGDTEAKPSEQISAARLAFEMAIKLLPNIEPVERAEVADGPKEEKLSQEKLAEVREQIYGF